MENPEGQEVVIIRRNLEEEDESHHGGVWKIAFADFMTAMMAFFLVMWLISANEKTRTTIARYFNPIKFEDTTPNRRGMHDPESVETSTVSKIDGSSDSSNEKPSSESGRSAGTPTPGASANVATASQNEPSKGKNPVLSHSNRDVADQHNDSPPAGQNSASAISKEANSGDSFRDPFAPAAQEITIQPTPSLSPTASPASPTSSASPSQPQSPPNAANSANLAISKAPTPDQAKPTTQPVDKPVDQAPPQSASQAGPPNPNELRTDIVKAVNDVIPQPGPGVEVQTTGEGTLISLMDEKGFEMFAVGSARPQPQVAAMMVKIAEILKKEPGTVIIRGHTDGRVYKSSTYDNWRLSSDRADMARQMLINGGLDGKRIERIEGVADRQPKKPNDPDAAENRRIEILVKADKP